MSMGRLGKWLSCSMHTWHVVVGWLGRWLSCSMHTLQLDGRVGGLATACTHVSGMIGQVAQL